ncbi:MAG TPA: DUF2877 domain-containing protein [Phycicoccus sp.]|nr:DUF2877 domain-containing protein [Phycicoccus sp.]
MTALAPAAISALTAPVVATAARRGASCRVLAASPKGLYLHVDGDGRAGRGIVLPLLTADAWALPTAARMGHRSDESDLLDRGLSIGDEVRLDEGGVQLPACTVRFVRTWQPARVPVTGRPTAGSDEATGAADGFVGTAGRDDRQRTGLALMITHALCTDDPAPHVRGLLGLGPGLTPSGDDALAGALLVLWASGVASPLPAAVRAHLHRTTALSASLLAAAADGYAVQEVVAHVRAAVAGDVDAMVSTRHTVESIGHWSGRDLLSGIDTALCVLRQDQPHSRSIAPLSNEPYRSAS